MDDIRKKMAEKRLVAHRGLRDRPQVVVHQLKTETAQLYGAYHQPEVKVTPHYAKTGELLDVKVYPVRGAS